MKKIIILSSIFLIGCTKPEQPKDCNCNKVIASNKLNLPNGYTFGQYTVKNECSGKEQTFTWSYTQPKIGDCK